MVRNYIRKTTTKYSQETLEKCLSCVRKGKMSMKKASRHFNVPYRTIRNKINNFHPKTSGGQTALQDNLEEHILNLLDLQTDWKVPFDGFSVWCFVKAYLDKKCDTVSCFKENMPGNYWLCGFVKRHNLTKRITDNVKAARAEVNHEVINNYFHNLEEWIKDIPPENIYNYDETNITDDPGAKLVITQRGKKQIERKIQHSKSSVRVMFAGNAAGQYLPPMVFYKSENIYREWVRGGPANTVYECTKNGWFDL